MNMPSSKTHFTVQKLNVVSSGRAASGSGSASKPSTRPRSALPSANGTSAWAINPNWVIVQTEIGLAFRKWHVSMCDKPKLGYRQPEDAYGQRVKRLRREIIL